MIEHACTQRSIIVKHQSPRINVHREIMLSFHLWLSISDNRKGKIIFLIRSRISRGWIMLDNWVASTRRQWFLSLSPFVMPGSWPIEKTGRISNGFVSYSSLPFPYNTCQRSKIPGINSGCIVRHVSSRRFFIFFSFLLHSLFHSLMKLLFQDDRPIRITIVLPRRQNNPVLHLSAPFLPFGDCYQYVK